MSDYQESRDFYKGWKTTGGDLDIKKVSLINRRIAKPEIMSFDSKVSSQTNVHIKTLDSNSRSELTKASREGWHTC